MPSPFPGMNPYLEQTEVWQDFRQSFVPHLREVLSPQVRPEYIVKVEEQLFIHGLPPDTERFVGRADVSVSEGGFVEPGTSGSIAAPVLGRISLAPDVERRAFLEIRDRSSRRLVTVVEVLSPSNKYRGPDRDQYLAKRRQLFCGQVHLVELDLLRGGPRLPVESLPACDYCVLISRYEDRPQVGLWPIALRYSTRTTRSLVGGGFGGARPPAGRSRSL